MEFPKNFLGIINYCSNTIRGVKPPEAIAPDVSISTRGVFIWRVHGEEISYDIYGDYKGRGFWVVDASTGTDLCGPVRANWRSEDAVLAATRTLEALGKKHQTLFGAPRPQDENEFKAPF